MIAYVVLAPDRATTADDISLALRERLTGPKRPKAIVVADMLPRNSGGKVDKAALRATYLG
ncbi:MAG: hypothetical protein U0556_18735 [Dehalococcoidia bacterium]